MCAFPMQYVTKVCLFNRYGPDKHQNILSLFTFERRLAIGRPSICVLYVLSTYSSWPVHDIFTFNLNRLWYWHKWIVGGKVDGNAVALDVFHNKYIFEEGCKLLGRNKIFLVTFTESDISIIYLHVYESVGTAQFIHFSGVTQFLRHASNSFHYM